MEQVSRTSRPLGVTIMAVLLGIEGILEIILGIVAVVALVALGQHVSGSGHHTTGATIDVVGAVIGSIPLVIGLVTLIFSIALWTLRSWAYWAVVIFEGITVLYHIVEIVRPTPSHSLTSVIAGMVIPVIILLYFLIDSNVRHAFRV